MRLSQFLQGFGPNKQKEIECGSSKIYKLRMLRAKKTFSKQRYIVVYVVYDVRILKVR